MPAQPACKQTTTMSAPERMNIDKTKKDTTASWHLCWSMNVLPTWRLTVRKKQKTRWKCGCWWVVFVSFPSSRCRVRTTAGSKAAHEPAEEAQEALQQLSPDTWNMRVFLACWGASSRSTLPYHGSSPPLACSLCLWNVHRQVRSDSWRIQTKQLEWAVNAWAAEWPVYRPGLRLAGLLLVERQLEGPLARWQADWRAAVTQSRIAGAWTGNRLWEGVHLLHSLYPRHSVVKSWLENSTQFSGRLYFCKLRCLKCLFFPFFFLRP